MAPAPHQELLERAIATDGAAYRALLAGDGPRARALLAEAAGLYRRSWELAPPRSFGRLVAMEKSALLAGDPSAADYVRDRIEGAGDSPTSCYAVAVAALARGEDELAARATAGMRGAGEAFDRAAEALERILAGDAEGCRAAVAAIVADFATREAHLTGVPIADTALLMEELAGRRGLVARPASEAAPPA
ncbi:MAG: hypothetical protein AB7V42_15760 [Thermoleophilia bacterium]